MFGIEKDLQNLMEQVYGPLGEKNQMPFNNEIQKVKAEIKMLQSKLSFLEELEKTKSPEEKAYKEHYGKYPVTDISEELTAEDNWNVISWSAFQKGYSAAYEEKVSQEPEMKPYLLISGANYYPSSRTGDWIDCYETIKEAKEKWEEISKQEYRYDWYKIVDLRDWMNR